MSACKLKINVQFADFSLKHEAEALRLDNSVGAIVTFSGLVRDMHEDQPVDGLFLEHYPGMTEKSLQAIAAEAQERWPLLAITIIHRIGELKAGDQIVFVGVSSGHRGAAFSACEFIMDYLKTRAPFWKKSLHADGACWVDAKESDETASGRWHQTDV
jgi:molybdopterin synthase catalytic subunit